ncbi:hypothetical protein CASFOL_031249 [Castilleja foliolosa]|uniref:Uncharacterized protein n=1 Tax=Castilleja foliolosa TaxID=1961234 RepID=A0ABD3C634_9LAMI
MAQYAMKSLVPVMLLVIIFTMFVMCSSARLLSDQELVDSRNTMVRILGIHRLKLEYYKMRARMLYQIDRFVPGGPDPHHH